MNPCRACRRTSWHVRTTEYRVYECAAVDDLGLADLGAEVTSDIEEARIVCAHCGDDYPYDGAA